MARLFQRIQLKFPMTDRHYTWITALVLGLYVLLVLGFSTVPIFEGIDEIEHYRFIHYLSENLALPEPDQPRSEYHQPPLYYLLGTPVGLLIDDADFITFRDRRNVHHGYLLTVPGNDNKNTIIHTRAEAFPYTGSGTSLAVHILRLMSIAMGFGTLLAVRAILQALWPESPPHQLLGLGIVAFWPQFLYLSATVNNDNLVILISTVALLLLVRIVQQGTTPKRALLLGLTLGLALITKVNTLVLGLPTVLAFALVIVQKPVRDRAKWRDLLLAAGVVIAVAGWWYLRNTALYGSPFGVTDMLAKSGWTVNKDGSPDWIYGLNTISGAYDSFWARFGHNTLGVHPLFYAVYDVLSLLALGGLILWAIKVFVRRQPVEPARLKLAALLSAFFIAWLLALYYASSLAVIGNQGRYVLPALGAFACLFAVGLSTCMPASMRPVGALSVTVLMFGLATAGLLRDYLPAYRASAVPGHIAHPVSYRFDDSAELIGAAQTVTHGKPGDLVRITIYWRAIQPTASELMSYLHTLESDLVRRDSFPATGNLRSVDWQPGQTWAETYLIEIPADTPTQVAYPLVAGLYDPGLKQSIPAFTGDQEVVPYIGFIAVHGNIAAAALPSLTHTFGEGIGLADTSLQLAEDKLTLCMDWVSRQQADVNYHVFVHVIDDGGLIAQWDGEPKQGLFPTSFWQPGEVIHDCVTLYTPDLPEAGWAVRIGMYDAATGQRLPAATSQGDAVPDNAVTVNP
jgi:4-amino-4-deoxy-L-arabinose transferase-like glycosyltransferase